MQKRLCNDVSAIGACTNKRERIVYLFFFLVHITRPNIGLELHIHIIQFKCHGLAGHEFPLQRQVCRCIVALSKIPPPPFPLLPFKKLFHI